MATNRFFRHDDSLRERGVWLAGLMSQSFQILVLSSMTREEL
jgi:hypothetical protein